MTTAIVFGIFGALLGACIASFCCVLSERIPRGESINGRSLCACGRQLSGWENIPVVGWLATRGTARCCGATLPVRYLVAEVAYLAWGAAVGAVLGAWHSGHPDGRLLVPAACAAVAFVAFGAALTRITWQPQPNEGARGR